MTAPRVAPADPFAALEAKYGGTATATPTPPPSFDALEAKYGVAAPTPAPRFTQPNPMPPLPGVVPPSHGVLDQAVAGVKDFGAQALGAVRHPLDTVGGIVTSAGRDLANTFTRPVVGEQVSLNTVGGRLAPGTVITRENTPDALDPKQFLRSGINTAANAVLPILGPLVGAPGRVAANAALGAVNSEDGQRVRGAVGGMLFGEALHQGIGAATRGVQSARARVATPTPAPVPEPTRTPAGPAPEPQPPAPAEVPAATPAPAAAPPTADPFSALEARYPAPTATHGAPLVVTLSDGSKLHTRYRVADAGALTPSHDPVSFQPRTNYPAGVQGRDYLRDPAAQAEVTRAAHQLDPDRMLDRGATAENGPPIITPDGIVIAGNQRTMIAQRAAAEAPPRFAAYRQALTQRLGDYGLDPSHLDGIKTPVLVRELMDAHTPEQLGAINRLSDTPATKAMRGIDDAAGRAKRLQAAAQSPDGALAHLSATLDPDETLADYLGRKDGRTFVDKLVSDRVLAPQEVARFVDPSGALTDDGKLTVRRILAASALDDPQALDAAPKITARKIEHALPLIAATRGAVDAHGAAWDAGVPVGEALRVLGEAQRRGVPVRDVLGQGSLLDDASTTASPEGAALAQFLESAPQKKVTDAFRTFATQAREAAGRAESVDMFGETAPSRAGALSRIHGVPEPDMPARPAAAPATAPAAPATPKLDAILHAAEPEAAPRPAPTFDALEAKYAAPAEADGVEYRHGLFGMTPATLRNAATMVRSALRSPTAAIEEQAPRLADAIAKGNAASMRAQQIATRRMANVFRDVTPDQETQFGRKLLLDNYDAEAQRKAATDPAAAARFQQLAADLRPHVTPGVEAQPWFQKALTTYKAQVEHPLREAAIQSGVDPAAMRQPATAYVRLMSEDRADARDILRPQRAMAADPGRFRQRPALLARIAGENPERVKLHAPGTGALRQGPVAAHYQTPDVVGGEGIGGSTQRAQETGSAKRAEGTAASYLTDVRRIIAHDAPDKIRKAAKNAVFAEVAQHGRALAADELPTPGSEALAFDDTKGLVTGSGGTSRYEVSPEIANAVKRFHENLAGKTPSVVGEKWRRFGHAQTGFSLAGTPVAALMHSNSLASAVGTNMGEVDMAGRVVAAVPMVGGKLAALREMRSLDFTKPDVQALENRLADAGALRVEEEHGGALQSSHNLLFGQPEGPAFHGVDTRGRLVLARKYLDRNPNATDAELRRFITGQVGNYVRGNSGDLVNGLQDSGMSAFARFQAAKLPTSAKRFVGISDLPPRAPTTTTTTIPGQTGTTTITTSKSVPFGRTRDVANTLWRGPLGYAAGATALGYGLVGHGPRDNEPGHEMDVPIGYGGKQAYIVNGRVQRLSAEEAQAIGRAARPLYIPAATINPMVAAGARVTGLRNVLRKGATADDMVGGAARDVVNTALSFALGSPAVHTLSTLATGRSPYLQSDGTMRKEVPTQLSQTGQYLANARAAFGKLNPALHAFAGDGGEVGTRDVASSLDDGTVSGRAAAMGARLAEVIAPRLATVGVGGVDNDQSLAASKMRQYESWQKDVKADLAKAPTAAKAQDIVDRAVADAKAHGYDPDATTRELTRYLATRESAPARQGAAVTRFQARHVPSQ